VTQFSASYSANKVQIIKSMTENVDPELLRFRIANAKAEGYGGNADGEALLATSEFLVPRKEHRRAIIVLSDGAPSASAHQNAAQTLDAAINTVKKRGIEIYGIGIFDDSVKRFYGRQCPVITDIDALDGALITTLKECLV
jgi:cobalamin biosynthesis protein CobT